MSTDSKAKHLIYRAARLTGLFTLARKRLRKGLLILCYHGFAVEDEAEFLPKLFIGIGDFRRRLEWLKSNGYVVLPLGQALEALEAGRLPKDAVVITIDDGFHTTFSEAAPALRDVGFPATVYVTTYYVEKENPIFRLAVRYLLWRTSERQIDTHDQPWGLQGTTDIASAEDRRRLAEAIISYGESELAEEERFDLLRRLGDQLGVDYQALADSRILSLMTVEELLELEGFGVDIQLHTHRHRFPCDDRVSVSTEITENREYLSRIVDGDRLIHFCYPVGRYWPTQWPWLEELGVVSAVTCEAGYVSRHSPPYKLPRFLDGAAISEIEFEAELCGFSQALRDIRAWLKRQRHRPHGGSHTSVGEGGT